MSRFYGTLMGTAKTPATRQGTSKSGLVGQIRGWDAGVKVYAAPTPETSPVDVFCVYMTSGSNNRSADTLVGWVCWTADGPIWIAE